MSRKLYGSVNSQATTIDKMYGGVNNNATTITKLYGSVGGQSKLIHQDVGHINYYNHYGEVYYYSGVSATQVPMIVVNLTGWNLEDLDRTKFFNFISTNNIEVPGTVSVEYTASYSRTFHFPVSGGGTVDVTSSNLQTTTGLIIEAPSGAVGDTYSLSLILTDTADTNSSIVSRQLISTTEYNDLATKAYSVSPVTVGGVSILPDAIVGFKFGDLSPTTPDYFLSKKDSLSWVDLSHYNNTRIGDRLLYRCKKFNSSIEIPSVVTSIGQQFLGYCPSFNYPLTIPNTVTSIGSALLYQCTSFNSAIVLPNTLTAIPNTFLNYCTSFNQPITIPNTVTSIGQNFLSYCEVFNQPLAIPNSVGSIGRTFLGSCRAFNQQITITGPITKIEDAFMQATVSCTYFPSFPNTVTTIGNYVLSATTNLNSPVVLPNTITTIGNSFMYNASHFDSAITLPSSLISIGNDFMNNCWSFNQQITLPSTLTTIGNNFMRSTLAFNQNLTIPNTITTIGTGFLGSMNSMVSTITCDAPATVATSDNYTLSANNINSAAYTTGISLTGTYANDWHTRFPDNTSSPYRKTIVV